ncbi:MAG TPA: DUF484 family protein [Burkholderiales bacterium]|nr:DUF484 family protein [Burkholderiales bacterium]
MNLDPNQIAEYLRKNPDFFENNITLLTDVEIPHPHGGRAISISERQVLALREKNRLIESKLAELIQFAEENDAITEKIHHFAQALIGCESLENVLTVIYSRMREEFAVPHTLVRLWHPSLTRNAIAETTETADEVRKFVSAMKTPYCGNHAVYETNRWFGEIAPHLRSFAMTPLADEQAFGVLLLASEEAQRFYPEMGTVYLTRISELASAAIKAQLT